jgi:hypothetical protein
MRGSRVSRDPSARWTADPEMVVEARAVVVGSRVRVSAP